MAWVMVGAVTPAWAAEAPVSSAEMAKYEKGFGALQQGTRTFSAEILQTLILQGLDHPIVSKGILYFANPDKLLIRFSQPAGEWMLVNASGAAIKKKGQPVDFREAKGPGKGGSRPANLLDFFRNGPDHWHQNFDVSMTRDGDKLLVHLKPWMTPTSTFQGVDSIITTLQLPSYEIISMEIAMSGANRVRYEFSDAQRNPSLAPALFIMPKEIAP